MKRRGAKGLTGPVGVSFAFLGYLAAVLVARTFVALEEHCTQGCPDIRIRGFQFHHMYYGIILVALAFTASTFVVDDLRTKWDAALLLGIGLGLATDEIGLLFLKVSYWSIQSVAPVAMVGLSLALAALYRTVRNGTFDFHILDRADILTVVSLLLALAGFLYFNNPTRIMVSALAMASWAASLALLSVYGRKHLTKIRQAQVSASR